MRSTTLVITSLALATLSCAPGDELSTRAQSIVSTDDRPVVAMENRPGARFGMALDIQGDLLAVGAPEDDEFGHASGAAYLFFRGGFGPGWTQFARFTSSDPAAVERFGGALALDGDVLAIAAAEDQLQTGAVYVHEEAVGGGDWGEFQKLVASDADGGDIFGRSVDVEGSLLVVGALFADVGGAQDTGQVYVFERGAMSWVEVATLRPDDASASQAFGSRVAFDGDTLAVATQPPGQQGSVYLFEMGAMPDDWTQIAKLASPPDTTYFGLSLALQNDRMLVGSDGRAFLHGRDVSGSDEWGLIAELEPDVTHAQQGFGGAVALDGDVAAVGALGDDTEADFAGAVYLFERDFGGDDAWGLAGRTTIPTAEFANYGRAVALQDDELVASAPFLDSGTGAVWVSQFDVGPTAVADTYSTAEDEPLRVAAPGVLSNDASSAAALSALVVLPTASGQLTLQQDGSFEYIPNADFFGTDRFTYVANDGNLDSNVVEVTLDVTPIDDAPRFDPQTPMGTIAAEEGSPLQFVVVATDPDGDAITYGGEDLPDGATLDPSTGEFHWIPGYRDAALSVTASDGTLTARRDLLIEVDFRDGDRDGIPDTWENENGLDRVRKDSDRDGIPDSVELGDIDDPTDTDDDGIPDALDEDSDGDGISDADEVTSGVPIDTDNDGLPDYRDLDSDADGVPDADDNCRTAANPGQDDADGDGIGTACDAPEQSDQDTQPASTDDGCGCGSVDAGADPALLGWLLFGLVTIARRRRRRPRGV